MNKDTRIFLTGATGFTGSYIARTLLHKGYQNITAIKRKTSQFNLLDGNEQYIDWIEADLEDLDKIDEALKHCDVVIHAAAIVNFNGKDKNAVYHCNVKMVQDLVNIALQNNIKKFIHLSSIAAIGRTADGSVVNEQTEWTDSPLNSDYGKSKYLGEMEVWRGAAEGLPVLIFNPSLIIGAGYWNNTTPAIFTEVKRGHKYYPLGSNGMVDVRDVANAIILGLESDITNERFLLNAENISYFKMFSSIAKQINATIPTKPLTKTLQKLMIGGTKLLETLRFNLPFASQQLQVLNTESNYDAQKSIDMLGMMYRSSEVSLSETASSFNQSKKENKKYGILSIG